MTVIVQVVNDKFPYVGNNVFQSNVRLVTIGVQWDIDYSLG